MNFQLKDNYWDRPELKNEFKSFSLQLFGLDLSLWDRMGFWDRRYRPFSIFCDDTLVSNLCVYTMDMTIQGRERRVAQFSAVGTLPQYRGNGLGQQLVEYALDWARDNHDFYFLFADEAAYPFYHKFGFRAADEYKACIPVVGAVARPGAVRLDMHRRDHIEHAYRLASCREPVSDSLGVTNNRLFMFWCLYALREQIHYVSALDLLVLYKREGGRLTVFDVVGENVPSFAEIYPYICDPGDEAVEFFFMADKLNLADFDRVRVEGNGTHLCGTFPLEGSQFIFPFTCHA